MKLPRYSKEELKKKRKFEHKDWDKKCDGGLLPASNIDCLVCIKCGYDSRGRRFSKLKRGKK